MSPALDRTVRVAGLLAAGTAVSFAGATGAGVGLLRLLLRGAERVERESLRIGLAGLAEAGKRGGRE